MDDATLDALDDRMFLDLGTPEAREASAKAWKEAKEESTFFDQHGVFQHVYRNRMDPDAKRFRRVMDRIEGQNPREFDQQALAAYETAIDGLKPGELGAAFKRTGLYGLPREILRSVAESLDSSPQMIARAVNRAFGFVHEKGVRSARFSKLWDKIEGELRSGEREDKAVGLLVQRKLSEPPPASVADLDPEEVKSILDREYQLEVKGPTGATGVGDDAHTAAEVARFMLGGLKLSANLCEQEPSLCADNKGIPRFQMPQVENKTVRQMMEDAHDPVAIHKAQAMIAAGADPDDDTTILQHFLNRLEDAGVGSKSAHIPVGMLKATQRELITKTVYGIADAALRAVFDPSKNIVVSRDGYILDGHHRWAALLILDPERKMQATIIDMDMDDLLHEAHSQPGVFVQGMDEMPLSDDDQKAHKTMFQSRLANKNLRSRLIRLAYRKPELREKVLTVIAKEWPTEEARKKHLEDHPKADPKRHTVKGEEPAGGKEEKGKDKEKGKDEEKGKDKPKKAPSDSDAAADALLEERKKKIALPDLADLRGYHPPPDVEYEDLSDEHKEELEGYDLGVVGGDATMAIEIARKLKENLDKDLCKEDKLDGEEVCKGNLGLPRSKMPQITVDKTVKEMALSDNERIGAQKEWRAGFDSMDMVSWDDLPDKMKSQYLQGFAEDRKKAQAMVAAGADPNSDKTVLEDFVAQLAEDGVETKKDVPIAVGKLKATQKFIKAKKSLAFATAHLKGLFPNIGDSVIVTRDGHILDGHHRWAALMTIDPERKMKCIVLDLDVDELLDRSQSMPGIYLQDDDGNPLDDDTQKKHKAEKKPKKASLRARLVRFAHAHPEHRAKILPLLKKKVTAGVERQGYGPLPREFYLPKTLHGAEPLIPEGTDLAIYLWEEGDHFYGTAFQGRSEKPLWNYRFKTDARRQAMVEQTTTNRRAWVERKKKQQEARRQYKHDYVVGDILSASWGYDQTNVNYYEIVEVRGKQVLLREIGKKNVRSERGAEYVGPAKGKFISEKMRRTPNMYGGVKINSSIHASKWDGKPMYETAFGWGH